MTETYTCCQWTPLQQEHLMMTEMQSRVVTDLAAQQISAVDTFKRNAQLRCYDQLWYSRLRQRTLNHMMTGPLSGLSCRSLCHTHAIRQSKSRKTSMTPGNWLMWWCSHWQWFTFRGFSQKFQSRFLRDSGCCDVSLIISPRTCSWSFVQRYCRVSVSSWSLSHSETWLQSSWFLDSCRIGAPLDNYNCVLKKLHAANHLQSHCIASFGTRPVVQSDSSIRRQEYCGHCHHLETSIICSSQSVMNVSSRWFSIHSNSILLHNDRKNDNVKCSYYDPEHIESDVFRLLQTCTFSIDINTSLLRSKTNALFLKCFDHQFRDCHQDRAHDPLDPAQIPMDNKTKLQNLVLTLEQLTKQSSIDRSCLPIVLSKRKR